MITELERKIVDAAQKYYTGDTTISDEEFDNLVDKLRDIDPSNPLLHRVGWGFKLDNIPLEKRTHSVPMSSLSNISPDDYVELATQMSETALQFTPKLDGAAVQVTYKDGVLEKALTRGDGYVGHDITDKVVHTVPLKLTGVLGSAKEVSISGEYILPKSLFFDKYKDSIAHRNIASGYLMRKELDESATDFHFVAFRITKVVTDDHTCSYLLNKSQMMRVLESEGFLVTPVEVIDNLGSSKFTRDLYDQVHSVLSDIDYHIDGIVATNSETTIRRSQLDGQYLEYVVDYDEVAIKENEKGVPTRIIDIKYNMTRTRKAVPTIYIDPVEISGAVIRKVAGHNYQYLRDKKLGVGAKVEVVRSGEVIPYISKVLEESSMTLSDVKCPDCASELRVDGRDLVCKNETCVGRTYQDLIRWVSYIGEVKGLGSSLRELFIKELELYRIEDIYDPDIDLSLLKEVPGIGSKSLDLIKESFRRMHSDISFSDFLVGVNIKGISKKTAEKLEYQSNLWESLSTNSPEDFSVDNCNGVGPSVRDSIISSWHKLLSVSSLVNLVPTKSEDADEKAKEDLVKVAITGRLITGTRREFLDKYSDQVVEVDVKDANYLITNNSEGTSSKLRVANKLGIKVISESDFIESVINGSKVERW